MIFPTQKIKSSKKDENWSKDCINYVIGEGHRTVYHDIERMLTNYRLVNSQLPEEDFRSICNTLGINHTVGKKYIHSYNKTPNIIFTLKGEELDRPFTWSVLSLFDQPNNKYTREDELKIVENIDTIFKAEMEKLTALIKAGVSKEMQNIPEEQRKEAEEQIIEQVERKYSKVYELDHLQDKYSNLQEIKEQSVSKLVKISFNRLNLKWIKNECFSDATIAGKEFAEVYYNNHDSMPSVRQLNPLNTFYHKSPDTPFTHDSDYAGYQEYMTIGQVLDKFGDMMSEKDSKKLSENVYRSNSPAYGTSDRLFHTRKDSNASSWTSRQEIGLNPSGLQADPHSRVVNEHGRYMGIPHSSFHTGNNIHGPGLYADNASYNRNFVHVYTVYWKSYRKIYKYEHIDDYGNKTIEYVSEDFVIPDNYKTEKYRPSKFADYKTKKIWYDDDNNYNCVEESWIPEIWKGIRLNGDIYVNVGPLEHAYQSLNNPYVTKIPIFGYIFNSRNSGILSIADRLQAWQKLYYSVMARLVKNLSQDKGVLTFLNALMISDEIGLKETLALAEDGNIIPYNPLAYAKGNSQILNTMKVAERVDATNSNVVQYYVELLRFIENQMVEAVGLSPQRLAQSKSNTTATDNYRETMHSMNITEPLFFAHDLLWEQIGQCYMEMLISALHDSDNTIRGLLDDTEIAVVDLKLISMEDEYMFKVANNIKNNRVIEAIQNHLQALIQNDKLQLSTFITLLKKDDVYELEKHVKDYETRMEELENQRAEEERNSREEMKRMEIENREDQQIADLNKEYLSGLMRRVTDLEKEHVKGKYLVTSYNLQNDADKDGVPDLMEADLKYKKFINDIAKKEAELTQRQEQIEIQKENLQEQKRVNDAKIKAMKDKSKQNNQNN